MFVLKNHNDDIKSSMDALRSNNIADFKKIVTNRKTLNPSTFADYSGKTFFQLVMDYANIKGYSYIKPFVNEMLNNSNNFGIEQYKILVDRIGDNESSFVIFDLISNNHSEKIKGLFDDLPSLKDTLKTMLDSRKIRTSSFMDRNHSKVMQNFFLLANKFNTTDNFSSVDFFEKNIVLDDNPFPIDSDNAFMFFCNNSTPENIRNIVLFFNKNNIKIPEKDSVFILKAIQYSLSRPSTGSLDDINELIEILHKTDESSPFVFGDVDLFDSKLSPIPNINISLSKGLSWIYNDSDKDDKGIFKDIKNDDLITLTLTENKKGTSNISEFILNRATTILYVNSLCKINCDKILPFLKKLEDNYGACIDFNAEVPISFVKDLFVNIGEDDLFIRYLAEKLSPKDDFLKSMYIHSVENANFKMFSIINDIHNNSVIFNEIDYLSNNYKDQTDYIHKILLNNQNTKEEPIYEKMYMLSSTCCSRKVKEVNAPSMKL